MILPKVRDPHFVTIRRGGTLTDADHQFLALWAAVKRPRPGPIPRVKLEPDPTGSLFDPIDPYPPGDVDPRPRVLQVTIRHDATDNFGVSPIRDTGPETHTVRRETPLGMIEVVYHVTVEPLAAPLP